MYRYLLQHKISVLLYVIFAPVSAVCSLAVSAGMAAAIDYANGGKLSDAWKYVIAFAVYILLDLAADQIFKNVRYRMVERTMVSLKSDVYHHISNMEPERFLSQNTADFMSALTTDTEIVRDSYFSVLLDLYIQALRFVIAVIVLFWLSPVLGIFVLATSILQTLVPILYAKKLERAGAAYSSAQGEHLNTLKENLNAFLTAKTFHIEAKLEETYNSAVKNAERKKRSSRVLTVWASNLSFVFSRVTHLGVFLLGAVLVLKGLLQTAAIVGISQLIVYISNPIYALNSNLAELKSAKAPIEKLMNIIKTAPDMGGGLEFNGENLDLAVNDLSFSYGERKIFCGFNYTFRQGGKYLIVGPSGSGKSTLLHLLAGLQRRYSGSITLGRTELQDLKRELLTENLCYIAQEPFLFDDTLCQNVCLFSDMDEARVLEVLSQVGLGQLVGTLPDGVHSAIGENAASISGGEKQRVALARALIRRPSIILLDESTSHLDTATAVEIERLVMNLEGVTVLLVSHNATDVAKDLADDIIQIEPA